MLSSIGQAIGDLSDLPRPTKPIDLEAAGQEYLRRAVRESRAAMFNRICPPEYQATDWTRPGFSANREQIARVVDWKPDRKGLILTGPTGRGKTRAAWQLLKRLMCEEGRDVVYWHAMDWFKELQHHVRYGRDEAGPWVNAVASHWLVFLDDYGQDAVTKGKEEWAEAWFFRFLDIRVERGLPLLITSNMTAKDMADRVTDIRSDALVRRILDLCDPVKFQ